MKIVIMLDEETGEMWYYILEKGQPEPIIIEPIKRGENDEDSESVH